MGTGVGSCFVVLVVVARRFGSSVSGLLRGRASWCTARRVCVSAYKNDSNQPTNRFRVCPSPRRAGFISTRQECFIQVIPTKVPTSISSSSVPTVSPNAPRPHPIPFPKTYSPHRRALSYAFMSRLCRTSMRLCFSIVRGAADFEQQRSSITWRAAAFVIACARARSCRGVWNV